AAARRRRIATGGIGLEAERAEPCIQHPPHFAFFPTLRPCLARTLARRTLAVRGRASRLLPARFGLIFAFEGLPQPLQFEDQCRTLRPGWRRRRAAGRGTD